MFNKKQISVAVRTLCLMAAMGSSVAYGAISQVPLFLAQHPYPNIMFTLDNSGSMDWMYMPDSAYRSYRIYDRFNNPIDVPISVDYLIHDEKNAFHRTASLNKIFYDPAIQYNSWLDANGNKFPDPAVIPATTAASAIDDPRVASASITRNNLIDPDTCSKPNTSMKACPAENIERKYKAFYYIYNGDSNGNGTGNVSNYTRKTIDSNWSAPVKSADRTDCAGTRCTYKEELQNFANWYTFYRKRIFTAIAGVSQTFSALDGKQRVGFGQINNARALENQSLDGVTMNKNDIYTVLLGVRDFVTDDRKAFFDKLFAPVTPSGGTPLRRAMDDVGKYFQRTDDKGPWAEKPGVSRGVELACRKSFHILMTDGLWNGGDANTVDARTADSTDGVQFIHPRDSNVKYKYVAGDAANKIFNSSNSSTLADVAMYYWKTDLYPNLENNVPYTATDPAFWQHLVQYTVGLGVDGELSFPGDTAGLKDGTISWPNPGAGDNSAAVDDLWHAAVNGHGLYFSAKNPKTFREGLTKALADIDDQTAVASTVALNFDQAGPTGNLAYVPSFQSSIWTGHLVARVIDAQGNVTPTESWDAAGELPAWNARNIYTMNADNSTVVAFNWSNLGTTQKTQVSADVVDFLRGNDAKEKANGGTFRDRNKVVNDGRYTGAKNYAKANKLGDIVNSPPIYVHKLDNGYNSLSGYRDFVKAKAARKPMLYVGANDGMLHAFDATTGVETFAYVPKSVYANLNSLSLQNYQHHYFVDGKLNEGDAYQSGSAKWKTLLSASTGAGARGVFMLDVTDPVANGANNLGASSVLWELSGEGTSGDADLGYMLGKTEVVHLQNGAWAAIFGNGYQSSSGKAVMYIVDAFTGNAIPNVPQKIVLESTAGSNGLSTPALVFNSKRELVSAYAGDLRGNLWKVDFAKSGAATVAYSGKPLFVAKDKATPAALQPIIQRPALGAHPLGGYMVMFGTGKYFDTSDQSNTQLQTAYGIWDNGSSEVAISGIRNEKLQEQTLTAQTGGASLTSINIDWTTKRGWFVDLALVSGARAVGDPYVTDETTFYLTSFTPVATQCDFGGKSQLMAFNYLSGGASSVFDSSTSPTRLSVVDVGATVSDPRVVRVPPTQSVPDSSNTSCVPTPTVPCERPACPTRKIIVSQLDGTVSERTVNAQCRAPMRVWHQLDINY